MPPASLSRTTTAKRSPKCTSSKSLAGVQPRSSSPAMKPRRIAANIAKLPALLAKPDNHLTDGRNLNPGSR